MKTKHLNLSDKNRLFFVLTLVFSLFTIVSCKKKCEKESCGGGRYVINGECQCPPGSFLVGDLCREKKPGTFRIDSTTCNCIEDKINFDFQYSPFDIEDSRNFDPRFGKYHVLMGMNDKRKVGGGGMGFQAFYDPQYNTIYTTMFAIAAGYGKNCDEASFMHGQFFNEGNNVRNKLKLRVYSHKSEEHELRADHLDKETLEKATDSCTIWLSNGFN
jgi:hypothetical protein